MFWLFSETVNLVCIPDDVQDLCVWQLASSNNQEERQVEQDNPWIFREGYLKYNNEILLEMFSELAKGSIYCQ